MTMLDEHPSEEASPELEKKAERAESWRGFFMALPTYFYLVVFFVLPLMIIGVFSFTSRSRTGKPVIGEWTLEWWIKLGEPLVRTVAARSVWLAVLNTVLCLLLGYPFAYWIATRKKALTRNFLLVLVLIPFWSNFLVRTYAWRTLLDTNGLVTKVGELTGLWGKMLFTEPAVFLGLLYGYLPFMVLPLYAAIEHLDWNLVEASRDLYATAWGAFRKVTLPLSKPGIIAGSILVFIPSLGAYVTPDLLGGAKTTLLGNYIVAQFGAGRNWPFGATLSFAVLLVMLVATIVYFRTGGKTL
jgi:spermidine/putrescine transport system permease protein